MPRLPKILDKRIITAEEIAVRSWKIEELHLRFSNGSERRYCRTKPQLSSVVMIIPMVNANTVLLVREYAAGQHSYQLQLPKGAVEKDEELLDAANRELKEEIGKGANKLTQINLFTALPGYDSQVTHIILAEDLYDERLQGDEPEELEVVPWALDNLTELVEREDCTEGRSIAALYYLREYLAKRS